LSATASLPRTLAGTASSRWVRYQSVVPWRAGPAHQHSPVQVGRPPPMTGVHHQPEIKFSMPLRVLVAASRPVVEALSFSVRRGTTFTASRAHRCSEHSGHLERTSPQTLRAFGATRMVSSPRHKLFPPDRERGTLGESYRQGPRVRLALRPQLGIPSEYPMGVKRNAEES
jgi:hypothetical protein